MKYIDAERLISYLENEVDKEFKKTEEKANSPIFCHFHSGCRKQALDTIDFIKSLQQERPSIPSNLDEAAHDYAWEKQEHHIDFDGEEYLDYGPKYDAFKAGAEWMARQVKQEQQVLPGMKERGIPGKDFIPVEWVDACEQYGKWKIVQQEQQEKSKKDCNDCPHCVDRKDQYGWHFKGCFGGPYKGKFIAEIDECPLEQEQPEVDFKIKERKWVHDAVDNVFPEDGDFMSEVDFRKILKETARHFYELGLNARKEERK